MFRLRRQEPRRVGQILYYLAACFNDCATQACGLLWVMLNELGSTGALEFDPDTWEGGPNDVEWFARVDAGRPIMWTEICEFLRVHGVIPRKETNYILEDLRDLPQEIRAKRQYGNEIMSTKVTNIAAYIER